MRGLFVTGTDTGSGKTILSAALLAAMAAAGERVEAHKPVLTGLDEEPGDWPADHELLGAVAGMSPEDVAPLRFGAAVAPPLAARLERRSLTAEQVLASARAAVGRAAGSRSTLVVEGVGGVLCPLSHGLSIADLAVELGLPVVVSARPGLGTINHTLLTLEAARSRGLQVRAVVLTPWAGEPSAMEASNREAISDGGRVEVCTLAPIRDRRLGALAGAGAELPWRGWLSPADDQPARWRSAGAAGPIARRARQLPTALGAVEAARADALAAASIPSHTAASSSSSIT